MHEAGAGTAAAAAAAATARGAQTVSIHQRKQETEKRKTRDVAEGMAEKEEAVGSVGKPSLLKLL